MDAKEILDRRVQNVFPSRDEVEKRLSAGESLTFYLGIDPTGPLHLGHSIPLLLLRDLQDLGHKVVVLIGDFTARLGDPTGKNASRVTLTEDQVQEHMESYVATIKKILTPDAFRYNSEWYSSMSLTEVINLTSRVTVQQMLARDMFDERIKQDKPIHVNEFLYPIMQGYDSVALRVDGEVGGNDQTFNMLVGREFEKEMIGKDKVVIATYLLADPVTGKKMSKTEGNFIALDDSPQEIRRKVLALDDSLTGTIFTLCTSKEPVDGDPRVAKEALAAELIRMYHGEGAVSEGKEAVEAAIGGLPLDEGLVVSGVAGTMSAAHRLIGQGATGINGEIVKEWKRTLEPGEEIQVGKGKKLKVVKK